MPPINECNQAVLLVRGVGYIILMEPEMLFRCVVMLRLAGECGQML